MTDTAVANAADVAALEGFDISVFDPSTWKEPVDIIPVKVVKSRPRWSDPKYNKATEFRPAFPNRGRGPEGDSIMQWDFQLERLDAEYALLDGTTAPVILYATVDLEKMVKGRDGQYQLQTVMKGRSKEALMLNAWTKAAGTLMPDPSRLEGQYWEVEYYRQKEMAPNFYAKNVVLPKNALPPTYTFTGQKLVFKQKAQDAAAEGTDTATVGAAAFGGSGVTPADAATRIADFIRSNGFTTLDTSVLAAPGFPEGCRIEPFISAFADSDSDAKVREVLASFGQAV